MAGKGQQQRLSLLSSRQVFNRRNQESAGERAELGQRRRKCPDQAYKHDALWIPPAQHQPASAMQQQQDQDQRDRHQPPPSRLIAQKAYPDAYAVSEPQSAGAAAASPDAGDGRRGGGGGGGSASDISAISADGHQRRPSGNSSIVSVPVSAVAARVSSRNSRNQQKENLVLDLNLASGRKRIRSSSTSSTSMSVSSRCPDTEYRQEFRCKGFHQPVLGSDGAAAGRPSGRVQHDRVLQVTSNMTRSATADLRPASAAAAAPCSRRPLQSQPVSHNQQRLDDDDEYSRRSKSVCGISEYKTQFREFDDYVYVDDIHMFQRKDSPAAAVAAAARDPQDQVDSSSSPPPSHMHARSWLDQVRERHASALSFCKRSHCGHAIGGNDALSKVYQEQKFPFPRDRSLAALALATTRLVINDKRKEGKRMPPQQQHLSRSTARPSTAGPTAATATSVRKARKDETGSSGPKTVVGAVSGPGTSTTIGTTTTAGAGGRPQPVNRLKPAVAASGHETRDISPPGKVWMQARKSPTTTITTTPTTTTTASVVPTPAVRDRGLSSRQSQQPKAKSDCLIDLTPDIIHSTTTGGGGGIISPNPPPPPPLLLTTRLIQIKPTVTHLPKTSSASTGGTAASSPKKLPPTRAGAGLVLGGGGGGGGSDSVHSAANSDAGGGCGFGGGETESESVKDADSLSLDSPSPMTRKHNSNSHSNKETSGGGGGGKKEDHGENKNNQSSSSMKKKFSNFFSSSSKSNSSGGNAAVKNSDTADHPLTTTT